MSISRLWLATNALALVLCLCVSQAFAQARLATEATAPQAPRLVQLGHPLSADATQRLATEGIRILHHYGQGRYLLSGQPSFGQAVEAASLTLAKTEHLGAFDVAPELRPVMADLAAEDLALVNECASANPRAAETPSPSAEAEPRYAVELVLAFPGAAAYLSEVLAKADFRPEVDQVVGGVTLRGSATPAGLRELLAHPYLLDASPAEGEHVPYSDFPLWEHRATVLNSDTPGDLNLNGEGVVIGIGDGGMLSGHPDVAGRVLYTTNYYNSSWGTHPDFVTSLAGGAGTLNPRYRGTASKAKFVVESSSAITYFSPYHFEDYGMTITNNSYGPTFNCTTANRYYGASASIDQQLLDNPKLAHVYASGNSGNSVCEGVAAPYSRIPGGAQNAKNALTVGNATSARTRFSSSSCGPTLDGRLKPEIIAVGHSVTGNDRSAGYTAGSGTSFSTPGVVGMLALFTEQYKKLHRDSLPDGALLKAVACNTAEDIGRAGPDFESGFGMISGTGGIRTLTQGDHYQGAVTIGTPFRRTLAVAAGTEQLRVMLYWHDRPGPTNNAGSTLVDDLDLYVLTPAGDTLRPWVLDARNPVALASRSRDTLNNIEQVTLPAPAAGTYTLVVAGRKQPFGKTNFALTWAALQPSVRIVHPVGGESFDPKGTVPIAWEGSPGQTGNWKVEYAVASSTAPGQPATRGAWSTISANLGNESRMVTWTPPTASDVRYVFRVTNLASAMSHEVASPITLLATPTALSSSDVCAGQMRLQWTAVAGAVAYDVFAFDGKDMTRVRSVTATEAIIGDLTNNQRTYFSVAAIDAAGYKSTRAVALGSTPTDNGTACATPLPVEWTSVEAADLAMAVRVSWGVAQEQDTDYFEVERSADGGDGAEWSVLGTAPARGYATSPAVYPFDDERVQDGETYYYRIHQVDRDGSSAYSAVIAHTRRSPGETASLFAVAENPVSEALAVRYAGVAGQLDVYDLAGRRLAGLGLAPGLNHLVWPANLASGVYVLRVADGGRVQSQRIIKR